MQGGKALADKHLSLREAVPYCGVGMDAACASLGTVTAEPDGGALRILARREGREILILTDAERPIGPDETLAHISWYPSRAIVEALAGRCQAYLNEAGCLPVDGWYPFFGESHIVTLVRAARTRINVTEDAPPRRWTHERVARLGFLAGLGWTAQKIADDPLIRTTANNVYRQAQRFGIALSDGPQGQICIRLPLQNMQVVDRAAREARLTCEAYTRRFMIAVTADPARFLATIL